MKTPRGQLNPELRQKMKDGLKLVQEKLESMTKEERAAFAAEAYSDNLLEDLREARMRSQKLAQETVTEEDALAQMIRNGARIIENPYKRVDPPMTSQ